MTSAAGHMLPATCHMPHATRLTPPGAWRLQPNKALERACRSIFGRGRVFHGVAGKSVSYHDCPAAWQRTELWWVNRDTGITELDCATWVDGDTGVTEIDGVTGSIYLEHPRVDRSCIPFCTISSHYTTNYAIYLSYLLIPLVLAGIRRSTQLRRSAGPGRMTSSHPLAAPLEPEPLDLTNSHGMSRAVRLSVDDGLSAC